MAGRLDNSDLRNRKFFIFCLFYGLKNIGYAVGEEGIIFKTTNGGANWFSQFSATTNPLYCVFFLNPDLGYAVGANGTILKTINGGTSWQPQNSGIGNRLNSVYLWIRISALQ